MTNTSRAQVAAQVQVRARTSSDRRTRWGGRAQGAKQFP